MLSRAVLGARRLPAGTRLLSSKAALVKGLAAEQKALNEAVMALGPDASYEKVKGLVAAEPFASTMAKVKADDLSWTWTMMDSKPELPPVTVAVSGAGSAVGAAALYRIAAGEMLGEGQPVALQLLGADAAVVKDLEACGFPLLKSVTAANDAGAAFKGAKYAIVLEGDFGAQGKAIAAGAKGALVAVAGNTNALAVSKAAGAGASVTAITRATQLAAEAALAEASDVSPSAVSNVRLAAAPRPPPPSSPPLLPVDRAAIATAPLSSRPQPAPRSALPPRSLRRSSPGARASPTSRTPPSAASGRSRSRTRRCPPSPSRARPCRRMPSSRT